MGDKTPAVFCTFGSQLDLGLNAADELLIIKRARPGLSSPEDEIINLGPCTESMVSSLQTNLGKMLSLASFVLTSPN